MLESLFDYQGWDDIDTMVYQFYGCVMKVDFGPVLKEERFSIIIVDFDEATMKLHDSVSGELRHTINITLVAK